MYRPKHQQKLTLAFVVLASAFILFTEPVSAQKGRNNRKSGSSSSAKQQAPKPAPAPRAQQPASAGRSRSSASPSHRASRPSSRSRNSSPVIRNNSSRTPTISRPSRSSTRTTSSRSRTSQSTINSNIRRPTTSTNVRRQTTGRINSGNSTRSIQSRIQQPITNTNSRTNTRIGNTIIPSIATQQPVVSSNNRISSNISSRIGNPIGTQPSTSTIRNLPTTSSTNRINSRKSRIFDTGRTPPQTVARQPAASFNHRISSSKSSGIGNMIGKQSNSTSRTRKLSTTNQINRNRSIIDSVKSPNRKPPSSVAEQPAGSLRNLKSSIDRADSRIGNVISPRRTPPPNSTRQPAAGLNSRANSSKNRNIGGPISKHTEKTQRTRKRISNLNVNRENSRPRGTINDRSSTQTTSKPSRERETLSGSRTTTRINGTRANRKAPREQHTTIINNIVTDRDSHRSGTRTHRFETTRPSRLIYRDRPYSRGHNYHYEHTYVDRYSRIRRKLIWPRYSYIVRYNWGPRFSYRYFYPYYHRKYVFVSLGGYWPLGYSYIRYHWYGCHPYYWYGYYPIAREVQTGSNNHYTYNYYNGYDSQGYVSAQTADSDYFDNLARQQAEPAQATLADSYFDEAVKAFEDGNYGIAINKFAKAMELAPDDMILPFAYCQALLAAERYSEAALALREALKKVSPEKEGVFFPRGLYPDEDILLEQLDKLAVKAETYSFDADLQLLLGYQLLGIGELDKAVTPLVNASIDLNNAEAAAILLKLLEKIKTTEEEKQEINSEKVQIKGVKTSSLIPSQGTRQIAEIQSQQVQSNTVNEKHATKIKETVLVATLCVLAGSTGIGHYFRT